MPESSVQLTVEIETKGAEQLTALRRELEGIGKSGREAFAGLDRSLRESFQQQRRFARSIQPLFQNFFRQTLSGARGFRDAFKRLFNDLLGFFTRTVSQMVATWLGGFRRLVGGSSSSGFLSGILPLPPGAPSIPGGALTRTGGAASSTAAASSQFTPFGGAFGTGRGATAAGSLAFQGGLLLAGAGVQSGNPFLGAAGGALAGFSVGGPIGLAVGAGIGAFAGLIGRLNRGARNRRRARDAESLFQGQLRAIFTEFEMRRLDFEAASASIDNAFNLFRAAEFGFGRPGRRALGRGRDRVAALLEDLERLNAVRQSRAALIAGGPLVEFRHGGFDPFGGLRRLHPGEFVFRPEAVRAFGRDNLERFNRNPESAAAINITIHVHAAPGMDERALARLTARQMRRELRDQGRRV